MRRKSRFKITVSDETRLHDLGSFRLSGWKLAALVAGLVAAALFFGALVVMLTPLRMMLPGYLGRDERVKAEMAILRLDSISEAESRTRAFLDNILTVTNTDRVPTDSLTARGGRMKGRADSLMDASPAERKFVEMMRDREKFNISVLAPLAADGMMFYPLSEEGIITTQSLEEPRAVFVVPVSSPLCAIADGTVITVSRLANDSSDVVSQHPKGFLSRCSGLGMVLVEPGSKITGGQVIGLQNRAGARSEITLEMWHNGEPLVPSQYVRSETHIPEEPSTLSGEPMGR